MEETTARGQVSRRTIAKGMAWAAPAIPVVALAPKAAASSIDNCVEVRFDGECKEPGSPDFAYDLEVCNNCTAGSFTLVSIRKGNNAPLDTVQPPVLKVWTAPANTLLGPDDCYDVPKLFSTNSSTPLVVTIKDSNGITVDVPTAALPCK